MKPTANGAALKVKEPILSIPVSWAIKAVPQINVVTKAQTIDNDFVILDFVNLRYFNRGY